MKAQVCAQFQRSRHRTSRQQSNELIGQQSFAQCLTMITAIPAASARQGGSLLKISSELIVQQW